MDSGTIPKHEDAFVLLVEDNADDEYFIRRSYRKASLASKLVAVDDAEQAFDVIASCGRAPCVLLLDQHAPDADALEKLRANPATREVPIIDLRCLRKCLRERPEALAAAITTACRARSSRPVPG